MEVCAVSGCVIRLTNERWDHLTRRHPEMQSMKQEILDTVASPDMVQVGDYGEVLAVRLWPHTPLTTKHLVVPYRETTGSDGFVLTAYLTRRPSSRRKTLWKR